MTDNEKLDLILSKLEKLDTLESDMQETKEKVSVIENKVTEMNLMLENEIRVNIQQLKKRV